MANSATLLHSVANGLASFGSHHMGLQLAMYHFGREYMLRQLSASLIEVHELDRNNLLVM